MANNEISRRSSEIKETYSELALNFKTTKSKLAFSKLYQKIYPSMFNYVNGMIKDYDEACDIVSNVMYKVYTKIEQYNPDYQITTWAFKIAYHETIQLMRDKNKKVQISETLDISDNGEPTNTLRDLNQESSNYIDFDFAEVYKKEDAFSEEDDALTHNYNKMIDEIRNLKPLYKTIMVDRLIDGLSYIDIVNKYNEPCIEEYEKLDKVVKALKEIYVNDMSNIENKKNFYNAMSAKDLFHKKNMITEQTVKNRLIRGKRILMEKFKEDENFKIYNKNILKNGKK